MRRLTVHGVEFDAVGGGGSVRRPFDAELVVSHVVGLDVGDVEVNCKRQSVSLRSYRFPVPSSYVRVVPCPTSGALAPLVYCASTLTS